MLTGPPYSGALAGRPGLRKVVAASAALRAKDRPWELGREATRASSVSALTGMGAGGGGGHNVELWSCVASGSSAPSLVL